MALPSGFSKTVSNPIGICLVLHALVVMPTPELVLPFNSDSYRITPKTMRQSYQCCCAPKVLSLEFTREGLLTCKNFPCKEIVSA